MKKKKWSKPECNKVKLIPEEAVITACKSKNGGGRSPATTCLKGNCIGSGS